MDEAIDWVSGLAGALPLITLSLRWHCHPEPWLLAVLTKLSRL